jgi:hypothetical protein
MAEKYWHGHGFDPTHQPAVPADFEEHPLVDEAEPAPTSDEKDSVATQVEGLLDRDAFPENEG